MEAKMHPSADLLSTPELNYEQWRDMLRPNWGLYTPDDPKGFAGRVRSRRICGFNASDISNNIRRCERTQSDVRADGVDHCYAAFQIAGRSTIMQNDASLVVVERFVSCASWPENVWPYVVAAWLVLGVLIVFLRPSVTRFDFIPSEIDSRLGSRSRRPRSSATLRFRFRTK
jgi:hypothetical protein